MFCFFTPSSALRAAGGGSESLEYSLRERCRRERSASSRIAGDASFPPGPPAERCRTSSVLSKSVRAGKPQSYLITLLWWSASRSPWPHPTPPHPPNPSTFNFSCAENMKSDFLQSVWRDELLLLNMIPLLEMLFFSAPSSAICSKRNISHPPPVYILVYCIFSIFSCIVHTVLICHILFFFILANAYYYFFHPIFFLNQISSYSSPLTSGPEFIFRSTKVTM